MVYQKLIIILFVVNGLSKSYHLWSTWSMMYQKVIINGQWFIKKLSLMVNGLSKSYHLWSTWSMVYQKVQWLIKKLSLMVNGLSETYNNIICGQWFIKMLSFMVYMVNGY